MAVAGAARYVLKWAMHDLEPSVEVQGRQRPGLRGDKAMEYTNTEMSRFVERIKLTNDRKRNYSNQIDNLKANVTAAVREIAGIRLLKVKRAGSWKKGTGLAPRGENPLDVDMVFFLEKDDDYRFDAEQIRDELIDILCVAYPSKAGDDFSNGTRTVGVVFRGTGLEVDIVPFVPKPGSSYGTQPEKDLHRGVLTTSVDRQLQFSSSLRAENSAYTSIVRILKHWRNEREIDLSSFALEILVGQAILAGEINGTSIVDGTMKIWEQLGSRRDIRVRFGARGRAGRERPWISDPANDSNNAAAKSLDTWQEIQDEAEKAFETVMYARQVEGQGRTRDLWKEVLGPRFNVDDED